jgi:hypothetical protein
MNYYYLISMKTIAILALCLCSLSTFASPADPGLSQKLKSLVDESKKSAPACEEFKRSALELLKGIEVGNPAPNMAVAMKLLALAKRYPGVPKATKEGYALVGNAFGSHELTDEAVKIEIGATTCDIATYMYTLEAVIYGSKPLHFSSKEKAEVSSVVLNRIQQDAQGYATLIEVMIYRELLNTLIDERVIEVSDAIFVETLHWAEELSQVRIKTSEAYRKSSVSAENVGLELQLVGPFARTLERVAHRLSPK